MSTHDNNGYMLIFRGTDWYQGLSPEQMQQVTDAWMTWFNGLKAEGHCSGGDPLEPEGKVVSGQNGVVSNGPFAESKEMVGGYFLLTVATMDEAVAIAQRCPGLPYGARVEVRPLAAKCGMHEAVPEDAEVATV